VDLVPRPLPKRLLDLAVAGALLVLLLPLILLILAAYAVSLDWHVLYREQRVSQGKRFGLLKFRTLRADVLAQADGHIRPLEADPANLTWIGRRILKPWYLDEIPQLLNVLRGDISLVGPRPWPPELVERQAAEGLTYRNEIVAGLTGPAQITKGTDRLYAELDTEYVERCRRLGAWTLVRHDVGILWRTIAVIARGQGLSY
jgi:lipopolysaccharide/colanic/teichoic acid biosynthesis glycosyltransferase